MTEDTEQVAGHGPDEVELRPTTDAGRAGLDAILAEPASSLFITDFDGVLAPLVEDPSRSRPVDGVVDVLTQLCRSVGQVLILTGREAQVVAQLIDADHVDGLESLDIIGQYGAERLDVATGVLQGAPPSEGMENARDQLPGILADAGHDGAYVEDKGQALAVHTRRLDSPHDAYSELRSPMSGLAEDHGLVMEAGNLVLELREDGVDKGTALCDVANERHYHAVMYAGDDLGDIPAFDAVDALRADGVPGLLVATRASEVDALIERADIVVDGPAEAAQLFAALAARIA